MPTLILDAVPMREAGVGGRPQRADALGRHHPGRGRDGHRADRRRPTSLGGFDIPTQGAFQLCFVIGAVAAFVGVAITATIPRAAAQDATSVEPVPVDARA